MTAFLVVLHVLVSLFLILFVLLQPGARGGVGAAFGGAGGQTVFGGRGANTFLAKLTAAAAVIFMFTSITLSYFGSSQSSVMAARAAAAKADQKDDAKATDQADAKPDVAAPDAKPNTEGAAAPTPGTSPEPKASDAPSTATPPAP